MNMTLNLFLRSVAREIRGLPPAGASSSRDVVPCWNRVPGAGSEPLYTAASPVSTGLAGSSVHSDSEPS
jgi:hypothetical protein